MRYDEFIGLDESFQPVYDLENEVEGRWRAFIPNKEFYMLLSKVITSLESNNPGDKKSILLQGTYGTGKSHATAVIKHLLEDDLESLNNFIEKTIDDPQIRSRLKNFRRNKRVFSVVLKGTSMADTPQKFGFVIQAAVKSALEKKNITDLATKSDFEMMIEQLKKDYIRWDEVLESAKLSIYGSKEDIISRLQQGDISILTRLEDVLSENNINFASKDISLWLAEVCKELKKRSVADCIVIYWDEFTGFFASPNSNAIFSELQGIAEQSINDVYLFIVVHRVLSKGSVSDDIRTSLDRFETDRYEMEPTTTYHLIAKAIQKKDIDRWKEFQREQMTPSVEEVISKIARKEETDKNILYAIFPIHPYTGYMGTLIARYTGSAERSIFKFLYDAEMGFKRFIMENPERNHKAYMTSEFLWDFFYGDFEDRSDSDENIRTALERFKLYQKTLEEKEAEAGYLAVFKGLLLLNIFYGLIEQGNDLVLPSEENVCAMFAGEFNKSELTNILSFIAEQQMITRSSNNLYLVTNASLPLQEVGEKKNNLRGKYSTVDRLLDDVKKDWFKDMFSSSTREAEVIILDATTPAHMIRDQTEKNFKKGYTIHICLFLSKKDQDLDNIKKTIKTMQDDDNLENVIFVIPEVSLGEDEFDKFLTNIARAEVAQSHNYSRDENIYKDGAEGVIESWIRRIADSNATFCWSNNSQKFCNQCPILMLSDLISTSLSKEIFPYGLENTRGTDNQNVWASKSSPKVAELFLYAVDRNDLEEKTRDQNYQPLRSILKDNNREYIVDGDLKIRSTTSEDHPLKKMSIVIQKAFDAEKNAISFNIGDTLKFLTKPPYGLFKNMISVAALSFLMRDYAGKLFEASTSKLIEKEIMRDKVINMFEYWELGRGKDKLEVRFEAEEERQLVEDLRYIFELGDDIKSLTGMRWKLRERVKQQKAPVWVYKFSGMANDACKKAIDAIFELVQTTEKELTYDKIREYWEIIKNAKPQLEPIMNSKDPSNDPLALFRRWLGSLEFVELSSDEEFADVLKYLGRNMPEEIATWTEEDTRDKVKNWKISVKNREISELKRTIGTTDSVLANTDRYPTLADAISSSYEEGKEKLKNKIENCGDIDKLKAILLDLIDKMPEIIRIVDTSLEEKE